MESDTSSYSSSKNIQINDVFHITQCLDILKIDEESEKCSCSNTISNSISSIISSETTSIPIDYNIPHIKEFIEFPINEDIINNICFRESLLISLREENEHEAHKCKMSDESYKEVGGFCLSIEKSSSSIVTYSTSQFSYENKGISSTILSITDNYLNVIEEKITETICVHDKKMEKSLHIIPENEKFIAFRTEIDGDIIQKFRGNINLNVTGTFIPDGLNFVLMRYLVISKFYGKLETWSIDIMGKICRSNYCIKPIKSFQVNGILTDVIKIVRTIHRRNSDPEKITIHFLTSGHLIQIVWNEFNYIVRINPLSPIPPNGIITDLHIKWKDDIQLYSKYLDLKESRQLEIKTYLKEKPELKCLIKDYIMILLQLKPTNILDFTIDYFINMTEMIPKDTNHNESSVNSNLQGN